MNKFKDLNKKISELESIQKDPDNYIYEYFSELTRQVDIRREILIEEIHNYSADLIQRIDKAKGECMAMSKKATEITGSIEEIKTELSNLNSMFSTKEMEDMKRQEVSELIEQALVKWKLELQYNKEYSLTTSNNTVEDLFGSLCCIKVNIKSIRI